MAGSAQSNFQMEVYDYLHFLEEWLRVAAITGLVVPGNQRHFGAKVAARILPFYCWSLCRRSNQKKRYKHVALEFRKYPSDTRSIIDAFMDNYENYLVTMLKPNH